MEKTKTTIIHNAIRWCDKVIDCIHDRFDGGTNMEVIEAANLNLNSHVWNFNLENNIDSISESTEDDAELHLFTKADLQLTFWESGSRNLFRLLVLNSHLLN